MGRTLRPERQIAVSYRFLDGRPDVRGIEEAQTLFHTCDLSLRAAKTRQKGESCYGVPSIWTKLEQFSD
jgi:hypothetical protein